MTREYYEESIKWRRFGDQTYFTMDVVEAGQKLRVTVTRNRVRHSDELIMFVYKPKGVEIIRQDVYRLSLARGLNNLMMVRFGKVWKVGASPITKGRGLSEQQRKRDRQTLHTERELMVKKIDYLQARLAAKEATKVRVEEKKEVVELSAKKERLRNKFPSLRSMDDID